MQPSKEWDSSLRELEQRRAFAQAMGGHEAVERARALGKLTARDRIDALVDPGSFEEWGALAGKGRYAPDGQLESVTPSTQVMGVAKVGGRKAVVVSDDFTIRGGSSEASVAEKWIYADRYAYEYRLPLVRMVDTAGGSVKLLQQMGHTKIPGYSLLPGVALLGAVPVVGIALGACAGLGAIRAASAHFSVMINNPIVMGGALTRAASIKMERFVDLCDTFHLPIVNLVDQPGTMTGVEAEREGTMYATLRAGAAIEQSSVPWCAIVIRRCFGLAGAMLSPKFGPSGTALPHRFAWPSATWGSIPIEGGVAAAYRKEIEAAQDPVAARNALEADYHKIGSPFRTAEKFGIVDIIEPAATRPLLCSWVEDAYALAALSLGPKMRTMR